METSNKPGCYIWIRNYDYDFDVRWSGRCKDGLAVGYGRMVIQEDGEYSGRISNNGERVGDWKYRIEEGNKSARIDWGWSLASFPFDGWEGQYKDNEPHGHWVFRNDWGGTLMGSYYKGNRSSYWIAEHRNRRGVYLKAAGQFTEEGLKTGEWWLYYMDGGKRDGCGIVAKCDEGRCDFDKDC